MKNYLILFIGVFFLTLHLKGQNIDFTDLNLKAYLINELCVDIDEDGIYDSDVDTNNDFEIQVSEATSIIDLKIQDNSSNPYNFESAIDLANFSNLEKLTFLTNHSVVEIADLNLSNLKFLWIGTCWSLRHVDISDLPEISHLRIEDIDTLDYINLQNGSFPDEYFSLFYTENFSEACVDSIAAEYEEVAWRMLPGLIPTINCQTTGLHKTENVEVLLFPNPTTGILNIETKEAILIVKVYDLTGRLVDIIKSPGTQLDLNHIPKGIYLIELGTKENTYTQKAIME